MKDFSELINSKKPALVDFFATWCGPCRMQAPIIEQLKEKTGSSATILEIDVDRHPELAARYKVQSVPTIILFKEGQIVWRVSGMQQLELLMSKINENIS